MIFANLVSGGIIRSVRQLLEGTRAVEAGQLDQSIDVATGDEIGQLAAAFNRMVVQLRENQRVRETFGKYIDPRVVEGLIDRPTLTAAEGQRRVMTVLFCDLKGFTSLSEGMTPQGLVKVMNRYLSTMSEPIRTNRGIIDKYIGDGIMAYWGPPFVGEADHARLACLAALEMIERIATLRQEIPELLGVRGTPMEKCDLRIGVATGEALVGSIGSDVMMSYTVMGDVVNLASRLEGANKAYGTRNLVSEKTIAAAGNTVEVREIDRVVVAGQTHSEIIFEILGRKGELTPQQLSSRDKYLEGLAAYREQRWDDALRALNASLEADARRRTVDGSAQAHRKPQSTPTAPGLGWVVAHRKIGAGGVAGKSVVGHKPQVWVCFEGGTRRETVVGKPSNTRLNFPVRKEERQERDRGKADDNGQEGSLHDPRSLVSPTEQMRMRAKRSHPFADA